jgi:hypothetical protein
VEKTRAIGLRARAGRYGGTHAHRDIAFEFGMWISPTFKIYLIKELQRLKEDENRRLSLPRGLKRTLSNPIYWGGEWVGDWVAGGWGEAAVRLAEGGDKAVGEAKLGFGQSGGAALGDLVPGARAHALDVFGEIERLGQEWIVRERAVGLAQLGEVERGRHGTGIPHLQVVGEPHDLHAGVAGIGIALRRGLSACERTGKWCFRSLIWG